SERRAHPSAPARQPSPSQPKGPRVDDRVSSAALEPGQEPGGRFVELGELIAAGEPQVDVTRAGVDPALEPLHAAVDRPRVAGLASQQRARRRRVVRLEEAMQPLFRGGGIGVQRERDVRRTGHVLGLASRGAGGRANLRKMLGEELDAGAGWKPRVEPGGLTERRRAATADPDRWATGTMWLRLDGDIVEREVLAAEADVVAGPQRATDLEHLEESSDPTLEWHADGLELLPDGRCVGRNADAHDHAPLGHTVERAGDVGQHGGVARRGDRETTRFLEPPTQRPRRAVWLGSCLPRTRPWQPSDR